MSVEIRGVKFRVGHEWRLGALWYPSGASATPGVLMLHGFPGVQKNEDLAAELCRRGMTVFMPYFRGSWGSPGGFQLGALLPDAAAALRLLSRYRHVDPRRLGVLGYSLGGWTALRLAAARTLSAAAALAPAIPHPAAAGESDYVRRAARVLNLPRPAELWREYLRQTESDRPEEYARAVSPTPLLLVQGLRDRLVPPESTRRLFGLAGEPKELLELSGDGHELQDSRAELREAVCSWLQRRLAAPASTRP